ncbi:MAG: hypothetical protein ACLVEZ_00010 [Mediterraneibacter faecis]
MNNTKVSGLFMKRVVFTLILAAFIVYSRDDICVFADGFRTVDTD